MIAKSDVAYPKRYETEVILKDGSKIFIRPIRQTDTEAYVAFINRCSPHTKYLRFHQVVREVKPEEGIRWCTVDYANTFAFVAEVVRGGRRDIVADARYYRLPDKRSAETAWIIEDSYQGKGIGTRLLEFLAQAARENQISIFEAEVLAENKQMRAVFRSYGFHVKSGVDEGVYHLTFPITRTRKVERLEAKRDRQATVSSLEPILRPKSIALIGASRDQGANGSAILRFVVDNGYAGTVYPVNPNAKSIMSVKTYSSVLDIPDEIDLAVVAVPADQVAEVADECGMKGVRGLVVVSNGFRETGDEGAAKEKALREVVRGHGMRLVGPNCMGLINTQPDVRLNASFSPFYPPHGNVAFLSHGGALGLAVLDYAKNLNLGISTFVSVGNRADVSANDLLQYWEQDPSTRVILLYLELFGNPRKFGRLARRISTKKPIIAVKGGISLAGSRAAASHTGAPVSSEAAIDALFRQAGIIRVNTLEGLFNAAVLLSSQPLPRGKRVAIFSNGGGPGILASDACAFQGLEVPQFSDNTVAALRQLIQKNTPVVNPLEITAGGRSDVMEGALKILGEDPENDAVIAILIPTFVTGTHDVKEAVRRASAVFRRHKKPLLVCVVGDWGTQGLLGEPGTAVPCYHFPEDAAVALARAAEYAEWLKSPKGSIPKIKGIRRHQARKTIESAIARSTQRPIWLQVEEIAEVLGCYGIRCAETVTVETAEQAATEASRIGYPVVIKPASARIKGKIDVGGVFLNLRTDDGVRKAFDDVENELRLVDPSGEISGVAVQQMISGGIEVLVGVKQDPSFGPMITFGLGGIYEELLQDVAVKLHPLTDLDAAELLRTLQLAKLFDGVGADIPPSDLSSLEDLLLRLSALVEDVPHIAEVDFSPVKVMPQGEGYWVANARIMLR